MIKADYLILGGGYAGVPLAYRLGRQGEDFLLVNRLPYQTLAALLPELITGSICEEEGIIWLKPLLKRVLVGEVKEIDLQGRKIVVLDHGRDLLTLTWNKALVISLGWEPDVRFPAQGVHFVRELPDAFLLRRYLYLQEGQRIVICGGGFVGVEYAGEIATDLGFKLDFEIHLVEAASDLLAGLPREARDKARVILEERGVKVHTGVAVEAIADGRLILKDGTEIPGDLFLWAAGVRANRLLEESGFEVDQRGRALVDEYLRARGQEDVFVIGDCAGTNLPMLGQIAVQQGKFLGDNLPRIVSGDWPPEPKFAYKGLVVSLGEAEAVAALGDRVSFSGMLAVVLKKILGKKYFLDIRI
ncbi:NAD(P)/FAD-dependent oxidoreductase [Thermosulfuriphilus sp.]